MLINHLGHVTLTNYGFQGHVMVSIIDFILFEFLDPDNHILDTEITSLSFIDPEIIEHIGVGGHLGRHLELWTLATGERHSPPIFRKHMPIRRKWDQSHLLIIKTATGDFFGQVAQDYYPS